MSARNCNYVDRGRKRKLMKLFLFSGQKIFFGTKNEVDLDTFRRLRNAAAKLFTERGLFKVANHFAQTNVQ